MIGTRAAHGPYDTPDAARTLADRLRSVTAPEPWTVVRIVEAPSRQDALRPLWREVVDARRRGWGLPSLAELQAQNEAALAAHPMPPVPETDQLIAALRERGLPVQLGERRWRDGARQQRSLEPELPQALVLWEYDEEAVAAAAAVAQQRHLAAQAASRPVEAGRFRVYQRGRLVVVVCGTEARVTEALRAVLGGEVDDR